MVVSLVFKYILLQARHIPNTDNAIGIPCIEGVSVSLPAKGGADGVVGLAVEPLDVLAKVSDDALALEIPDLDGGIRSSAEPVSVGAEGEGVDDGPSVEGIEVLALVQVPEARGAVLATRGAQGTVRGYGDGVEVPSVTGEVVLLAAVAQVPHLHQLVPPTRDDDGGLGVGGEAHAGHPLGVPTLLEGVLALTQDVPELDGLVAGAGDDLAVVGGEGNAQHVLLVPNESTGGLACVNVPETEHSVPRAGQGELTIG